MTKRFETKEEAMRHISTTDRAVAAAQIKMIDKYYDFGLTLSANAIDSVAYDMSRDAIKKAMSY